jgi:predicted GNAT family acetyltransferase
MKIYKIAKDYKEEIYFNKENILNDHTIKAISKLTNKEIGYVQYSINKDNILIVYIKVNPAFTKQGIGAQLIEEIIKQENIPYQKLNWDTITQYGQLLKNKLDKIYGPAPFKSYKSQS